jgi:nitrate reductase assembly molybdenum cofactor insertion protein NarJ
MTTSSGEKDFRRLEDLGSPRHVENVPHDPPLPTDLLRQAAEWRLIALLFEPPGDAWRGEVRSLGESQSDELLREAAELAQQEATPELYHSTFGPGGPVSPREVAYHKLVLPGAMVSEIEGYYVAFGYTPCGDEPPDHLAVEAGFIAYLRLKEAYALNRGEPEPAAVAAEASQRFMVEHLAVMARPLAAALADSPVRYLTLAAESLRRRIGATP